MDFHQNGPTTLHDLQPERRGHAKNLLRKHAESRKPALVLPMLYDEMTRPALSGIREGLRRADFLNEIVVALTAKDEGEVEKVKRFFGDLPVRTTVTWCEGPAVRETVDDLAAKGFDLRGFEGKGLAVWLGMGVASDANHALVMHDADIERYDPRMLHRLLLPVVVPEMDFFFAKGYYARLTDERMYGRVVRLFVWPFLDALQVTLNDASPFVQYLRSFRYPLSGEMAMTSDLARNLRIPTDWGLEVGILGEVYRNTSPKRIAQVDLGMYNHKHKEVGKDRSEGLQRMTFDIVMTVFRLIAATEGARIDRDMLTTLQVAYRREAQDAIRKYHMDSLANGLNYDRHDEELVVEQLEPLIKQAGLAFMDEPNKDLIGEWLRAISADPESPRKVRGATTLSVAEGSRLVEAAHQSSL